MTGVQNGRMTVGTLQAAVDTFKKEAAARSNPGQMFLSSSPIASQTQSSIHSTHGVLKAATSSMLNVQRQQAVRQAQVQGIKRTADGLAKALQGSFEGDDATSSQTLKNPTISRKKPMEVIVIDENDFESDVDLDVEEPGLATSQKQPATSQTLSKPIVYPTLPRKQQLHSTYQDASEVQIPSSTPFEWSSSPSQHMMPSLSHSAATSNPNGKTFIGFQKASSIPPLKRKTLPWLQSPSTETDDTSTSVAVVGDTSVNTPAPTTKSRVSDLWSGTASAIKQQQKRHRQEARATSKKNEATAETRAVTTTKNKKVPRVFLSEEQEHILKLVVEQRQSTFFTGSAGTGKSVLLREIIAAFRRQFSRELDRVAVTASTGLAACNIGGVTLHSFAGIGLGKDEVPELVKKVKRNQKAKQRWLRTKVLIIDEVSMVDADLFDKLEQVARSIRNNGRPFGGIQLVITGDFFQLPPVPDNGRIARFCFDAHQWNTTIAHTIGLHHVFRQKDPGTSTF